MSRRKIFSTRLDRDLTKSLKYLAVDQERPLNDLLEEAISDLLYKYQEKSQGTEPRFMFALAEKPKEHEEDQEEK